MLEASGVIISYGTGARAVDDVSVCVAPGEILALCGPNGAGKSTLLAAFAGDRRPSAGSIRINGEDIDGFDAGKLASLRAVLEQSPLLAAPFTARELAGLSIPRSVSPHSAAAIAAEVLADVGLLDGADKRADHLSGGQRHRAHLARALAQLRSTSEGPPSYLLLDEPTASLDLKHQVEVCTIVRREAGRGRGVLVVLHDLSLAGALADRIALMHRGKVVRLGTPEHVLDAALLSEVYGTRLDVERSATGHLRIVPNYNPVNQGEE